MKQVRYIVGAIGFLLVWFVVALVVGFIVTIIFPPANGGTIMFGIGFDWRNLPGDILGLLAGIHSFRASVRRSQMKDGATGKFTKLITIVLLIVFICIAAVIYASYRQVSQFDHLEQNAKQVVTGSELQSWAADLLAQYPTNASPKVSELGASFPGQLLGLFHDPPHIFIHVANTNYPASVLLMWGGGLIGHSGFEIGSTNFVSQRSNAHEWQRGVYFWSEYPQK